MTDRELYWNPLASQSLSAQVVSPMLASLSPGSTITESLQQAKLFLQSENFLQDARQRLRQFEGYDPGPISLRRVVGIVPILYPKPWISTSEPRARLAQVVQSLPEVQDELREFARRNTDDTRSSIPLLQRVETECVLPLLILWQGAGPVLESCLSVNDPETRANLRVLAQETYKRLPQIATTDWRERTTIATQHGQRVRMDTWAIGGLFDETPSANPMLRPTKWRDPSEVRNTPLFTSISQLLQQVSEWVAPHFANREDLKLDASQRHLWGSLCDTKSPYHGETFFSLYRGLILDKPEQDGTSLTSPLRAQMIRKVYDSWVEHLAAKGIRVEASDLTDAGHLRPKFTAQTWQDLTSDNPPKYSLGSRDIMLRESAPYTRSGLLPVWAASWYLLDARMQVLRASVNIGRDESPDALYATWQEVSKGNKSAAMHWDDAMRGLKALGMLPRNKALEQAETEPAKAMFWYWRDLFVGDKNPLFGLQFDGSSKSANIANQLLPAAYYRRLVTNLAEVGVSDPSGLAQRIWNTARECIARTPRDNDVCIEQALLAGALMHTGEQLRPEQAFALAFRLGIGTGPEYRLLDVTTDYQRQEARLMAGAVNIGDALVTGQSAQVVQFLSDCRSLINANNGSNSVVPSVVELDRSLQDLGKLLADCRNSLGSALGDPAKWQKFVKPSTMQDIANQVKKHQTASMVSMLGNMPQLVSDQGNPWLQDDFSHKLQQVYLAGVEAIKATRYQPERGKHLQRAVVASAMENIIPMLDRVAAAPAGLGGFTQVLATAYSQAEALPEDKRWRAIYRQQLSRLRDAYPDAAGIFADSEGEGRNYQRKLTENTLNELLKVGTGLSDSLLRRLIDCPALITQEQNLELNARLRDVFHLTAQGETRRRPEAVAWVNILLEALPPSHPLTGALNRYNNAAEQLNPQLADTRTKNHSDVYKRVKPLFTEVWKDINQTLVQNPLPAESWPEVRRAMVGMVHARCIKEAKGVESKVARTISCEDRLPEMHGICAVMAGLQLAVGAAGTITQKIIQEREAKPSLEKAPSQELSA